MAAPTTLDRFWDKVLVAGPDECWLWNACVLNDGYGQFSVGGGVRVRAHRFAYEARVGAIPDGLVIDHLCRNPLCVNPAHLEPVTPGENLRRGFHATKTECKYGHPLYGDNLRQTARQRVCRACHCRYQRELKLRLRGES